MVRLKDRQKQIPNGFRFLQPETGWKPPQFASFETIVRGIMAHRQGNPHLIQKFGWSTDYNSVSAELDRYNSMICKQMGWSDYYIEDGGGVPEALPKLSPLPKLRNAAAGHETIVQFLKSKDEAVRPEIATMRSAVCVACPKNESKKGFMEWFTVPVSNAIRHWLNKKSEWELKTENDDKLGVCEVCSCPLKLKVWFPIDHIKNNLTKETVDLLPEPCWIKSELGIVPKQ